MKIIPFEPWHIGQMEGRALLQPYPGQNGEDVGAQLRAAGPCYTGVIDAAPASFENREDACATGVIVSGGLALLWPGVATAWLYAGAGMAGENRAVARAACRYLRMLINTYNLHRVQANVHSRFLAGQRFVEWLGFRREGMARCYGSDGSHWLHYGKTTRRR